MSKLRLDKLLARQGFGTRSAVKLLLRRSKVQVNALVCTRPEFIIDTEKDSVCVDGQPIHFIAHLYLMLNKPQHTVCAAKDDLHATVFDLLDKSLCRGFSGGKLHLVGRLDADTEGLLICTTDGALTHRIISPKHRIPKTYFVCLKEIPSDPLLYVRLFKDGIKIPAEGCEKAFCAESAVLEWIDAAQSACFFADALRAAEYKTYPCCTLTIYEGKYHQVKRMFRAVGNEVVFLKRIAIGALMLDASLAAGEYRELSEEEIRLLSAV